MWYTYVPGTFLYHGRGLMTQNAPFRILVGMDTNNVKARVSDSVAHRLQVE